jgi:hypothetical protein
MIFLDFESVCRAVWTSHTVLDVGGKTKTVLDDGRGV